MRNYISKLKRFIKKKPSEQLNSLKVRLLSISFLPFKLGKSWVAHTYLTYQPDSFTQFKSHPEFSGLFKRFIKHNERNNSGDIPRLWSFILNCKHVLDSGVDGDVAELGVWRGNTASVLAYYAHMYDRNLYLFDTYEGFDSRDLTGVDKNKSSNFKDTSLDLVREVVGAEYSKCYYIKGRFPDSIEDLHRGTKYAIVSLDCDLYEPMIAGLRFFYPRMTRGGILLLHDYSSQHWDGTKKAVDEFCQEVGEFLILLPDKSGSAFLRKTR